jgi:hypothetical protein
MACCTNGHVRTGVAAARRRRRRAGVIVIVVVVVAIRLDCQCGTRLLLDTGQAETYGRNGLRRDGHREKRP